MLGVQHNHTFYKQLVHFPWMCHHNRRIPFFYYSLFRFFIDGWIETLLYLYDNFLLKSDKIVYDRFVVEC